MATDYKSSLPVRTEVDPDQRLQSKIVDYTNPANGLLVHPDGSIDVNAEVSATDLDIRDLVFATDKVDVSGSEVSLDATTLAALESITVQNGAGAAAVNIQDGGNSITVDATDLDIRDLAFATDKVDVSGSSVSITGDVNVTQGTTPWDVSATDLDIRDLTAASDSVKSWIVDEAGNAFSSSNPLTVTVVNQPTEGTSLHDYQETAALAQDTSETLDYTVPASKVLYLTSVLCSASGVGKFEIKANGATKAVVFNSTAMPNYKVELDEDLILNATELVEVICTNRDQTQSMYVTIIGELRDA